MTRWIRIAAGLLLAALALLLHNDLYHAAGPLWRDELAALRIATGPLSAMVPRMEFESFPIASFLAIRGWVAAAGATVASLRMFGFTVGILLLLALWLAARALDADTPLLSLALAGASAAVVRFGDAVRGHGLGCILAVLTIAALYRTVKKPSIVNWIAAMLACVAAVQTTYYNALVVLASCVAAAVAHRELRNRILSLSSGAIAAASLVFYLPIFRASSQWNDLIRYEGGLPWIWKQFTSTISMSGSLAATAWIALLAGALAASIAFARRSREMLFLAVALGVLAAGFIVFFAWLHYLMQPWYFIVFLCAAAVLIDAIAAHSLGEGALSLARAAVAIAIVFFTLAETREAMAKRWTAMDLAVAELAKMIKPNDLVVVYPWTLGVSFSEYYKGPAKWTTLPPVDDHSVHRFDLLKYDITHPEREQEVVAMTKQTLASGGAVWYAGHPPYEEGKAYEGRHDALIDADKRWCDAFDAAVKSGAHHSLDLFAPDANTSEYENLLIQGYAP